MVEYCPECGDMITPFTYCKCEEPPPVEHPVIGKCADCGEDGFIKMDDVILCYPCGYNRAN